MEYLLFIYIANYRQRFVRCYTNKIFHFETTTTSRNESEHAMLKRQLRSSIDDLKTVIDDINLMLMNEYQIHLISINEAKIKVPMILRKSIFQNLIAHVISIVLRKIIPQYDLLTDQSTAVLLCIGAFSTFMKLPCSHVIQQRLFDNEGLFLNDVHPHWR